jgi:hypothetical protein
MRSSAITVLVLLAAVAGVPGPSSAEPATGGSAARAGWSLEPTADLDGDFERFRDISCATTTSCVAVGERRGSDDVGHAVIESWNGTVWVSQPAPPPAGAGYSGLASIDCPDRSMCMAIGTYLNGRGEYVPLSMRWNGARWRVKFVPHRAETRLTAVSCATRSMCVAVGDRTADDGTRRAVTVHWDGEVWVPRPSPVSDFADDMLSGVSCPTATRCLAVGSVVTFPDIPVVEPLSQEWRGGRWRPLVTPRFESTSLGAVSCAASDACLAVGDSDTYFEVYPVAERWDGATWSIPEAQPVGGAFLDDVSCPSRSLCTGVGRGYEASGTVPAVQRLTADGWRLQAFPSPRDHDGAQLSAVDCPTRTRCVAVGFFDRNGRSRTLAATWAG